jgi:ubiquinone/menaquinone biosynthesis C-methylase UbiE
MSAALPQPFSVPFDGVAARYDETFTSSIIGRAQRAAVWKELAKAFHPGDRVLEIGCGTGVDACCLAERGVEVLACDPSSHMIEVASRRTRQRGFEALVRTCVLRAEDISGLSADVSFDGAFSNFGALNCVKDLRIAAKGIARLVRPGGTALLCWMGPYCLWETLFYLAQGNTRKAFRRFRREGVSARLTETAFVHVHYPSVRTLAKTFAPEFRVQSVQGIGVAVPPSYLESWARRHPRLMGLSEQFDSWFGRWPGLRSMGDHVLVQLERKQDASER